MLELYPYQNKTIDLLREGFVKNQRQLMVAPTGSGKTVMFSTIVERSVKRNTLTLVLTDRIELMKETIKSLESFGIPVCSIDANNKTIPHNAKMYVGMVETVKRRADKLKNIPFQLIICDEAHMANFNKIFEIWPSSRVIGATATPIGKHIYKYYTNLVSCVDTPELVRDGFLCECKAYQMQDDFSDVKIKSNGEFDDNSLYKHMDKSKLYDGVVTEWLNKCDGKKTIVFNVNIEHTLKMTAAFNAAGIRSYAITSKTPDTERAWILSEYKRGAFPVLNNCGILTKGFNHPPIEWVVLNRATRSLSLYLQMMGRGSRLFPGKKFFGVLDFGMNHDRHGMWNQARTWTLEPPKKRNKLGVAPVKACKACSAMLNAQAKECPYCGYLFPVNQVELKKGVLVELTNKIREAIPGKYVSQLTIPELIECEKMGQMKPAYVWRVLRARGAKDVGEYARIKKYKDAWIVRQLEAMEAETGSGGRIEFSDKKINEVTYEG